MLLINSFWKYNIGGTKAQITFVNIHQPLKAVLQTLINVIKCIMILIKSQVKVSLCLPTCISDPW